MGFGIKLVAVFWLAGVCETPTEIQVVTLRNHLKKIKTLPD